MGTNYQRKMHISGQKKSIGAAKFACKKQAGGIIKADKQATIDAQFLDPRSYIAPDKREVLYGEDWLARKAELLRRSGGRCEYRNNYGLRCIAEGAIPSHVIPRHPRRDDRLSNLKHQCIEHDKLTEKQAWRRTRFGERRANADMHD